MMVNNQYDEAVLSKEVKLVSFEFGRLKLFVTSFLSSHSILFAFSLERMKGILFWPSKTLISFLSGSLQEDDGNSVTEVQERSQR